MDVAIPFYKLKKIIEKDDSSNESFDFKYMILKQIETFKKMVIQYVKDRCKELKIIDMEMDSISNIEDVKLNYDIILNPTYKIKISDRYDIKVKSDILMKSHLLERIFTNVSSDLTVKEFVHINIVYKTINLNKKGQVLLTKFEKMNNSLLNIATENSCFIYIGRKYKTKNGVFNSCFDVCAISSETNHKENINELNNLLVSNVIRKKSIETNSKFDEVNPLEYKRKFKYIIKKEYDIKNIDIRKLTDKTIFLDFEFIPDLIGNFDTFPKTSRKSLIFMIGIGYIENNEWVYKEYTANELSEKEELKILTSWIKDMKILAKNGYKYIMHWSKAEKTYLSKNLVNYLEKTFTFIDLMYIFKKCQTDNLKYTSLSLKHISKLYNRFRLVELKWDNDMTNGKSAMVETLFCNLALQNKKRQKEKKLIDFSSIKHVIKYNEIDVKMMFLILDKMTK